MKTCTKCETEQPFSLFRIKKGKYYDSWCKPCNSADSNRRQRERAQVDPGYRKEYSYRANIRRHGISLEDYDLLLSEQGGRCAICGNHPEDQRLVIDHDHKCCPGQTSCGECIRGLLCLNCNTALGLFRDSETNLESAVNYLRSNDG